MRDRPENPKGRLIPLQEFAEMISRSPREVYRMIDEGLLPKPVKQGRGSFFFSEDHEAYLAQLRRQRG